MKVITLPLFLITVLLAAIPAWAGVVTGSFTASGTVDYGGPCQDNSFDSSCASGQCSCASLSGTLTEAGRRESVVIEETADEGSEIAQCQPVYASASNSMDQSSWVGNDTPVRRHIQWRPGILHLQQRLSANSGGPRFRFDQC